MPSQIKMESLNFYDQYPNDDEKRAPDPVPKTDPRKYTNQNQTLVKLERRLNLSMMGIEQLQSKSKTKQSLYKIFNLLSVSKI